MEYSYSIELPDDWHPSGTGQYNSTSIAGSTLTIRSQLLPIEYSADQFFDLVLHDLRRDWPSGASLFEITALEDGMQDGHSTRRIRYRVQESPQYCVVDVEELLVVSRVLPGHPHGFRVRLRACEHDALLHREVLGSILDRFQVTTRPATYYEQFISANGVTVKAAGEVDLAAVEAGADIVAAMLSGRDDVARCMVREGAELAIIPRGQPVTSLPEYEYLRGTRDFTGRSRDTFAIRGLGAVSGQPVSSAGEEQVLGRPGPQASHLSLQGFGRST